MTIAWGSALSKTHFDADTDDPSQARAELEAMVDRINTKLANVTLITQADVGSVVASSITGEVKTYAGSSAPTGYLFCNGEAVSRTTYSDLFDVIGTTFGNGDGSTTFNVPDLRDRSPLGENTMGSSDAGRVGTTSTGLGDAGGEDEHQLTDSEMPSHNHGGGNHNHSLPSDTWYTSGNDGGGAGNTRGADSKTTGNSGTIISTNGSDTPHNNMHPFLVMNFIIKT